MTRTRLLLLLVAGLLSVLVWLSRPNPGTPATEILSQTAVNHVDFIQLSLGGRDMPALKLAREPDGWQLIEPIKMPADELAVNEILRLLQSSSLRKLDASKLDLAKLSLAPPLWRVQIGNEQFEIGTTEALSGNRYVRAGNAIYLVADLNAARFDSNYADLVTRKLLPHIKEIAEIRLPGGQLGTRTITLLSPGAGILFDRWHQAQAQWLLRPSELDFADVHSRISVVTHEGHSVDFLIQSRDPQLQLIRPDLDLMYVLPASAAEELIPGA